MDPSWKAVSVSGFSCGLMETSPPPDWPQEAVRLAVPVDGRVGPDERGVDGAADQRLDRLAAGVEGLELQVDTVAQGVLKDSLLHPDDRRGVGDVGEVAEPKGSAGLAYISGSNPAMPLLSP
jgi:hypothetical protein